MWTRTHDEKAHLLVNRPATIFVLGCEMNEKSRIGFDDLTEDHFARARQIVTDVMAQLTMPADPLIGRYVIAAILTKGNAGLNAGLYNSLRDGLNAGLNAGLYAGLNDGLYAGLNDGLTDGLDASLYAGLYVGLRDDIKLKYCGVYWTRWVLQYLVGTSFGVELDMKKLALMWAFTRYCPLTATSTDADGKRQLVVLPKPTAISWRITGETAAPFRFPIYQLHNESGPSCDYPIECCKLWHINGIKVDEQIVTRPQTQTIGQINGEQNEDVKSIRIDRFGWLRYLDSVGAELIDERQNYVEGTLEQLYGLSDGTKRFVGTCPTKKIPVLGVPADIETCEQAARWMSPFPNINILGRT